MFYGLKHGCTISSKSADLFNPVFKIITHKLAYKNESASFRSCSVTTSRMHWFHHKRVINKARSVFNINFIKLINKDYIYYKNVSFQV